MALRIAHGFCNPLCFSVVFDCIARPRLLPLLLGGLLCSFLPSSAYVFRLSRDKNREWGAIFWETDLIEDGSAEGGL